MLRIVQVFNNNVALVDVGNHRQAVAKGKGIAFGRRRGDVLPANAVEKLFTLETEASRQNLYYLLKDTPIDVVTTTYEIIEMAQLRHGLKILDYIYITLSDHIQYACQRLKEGDYTESEIPDFHETYQREYAAASDALDLIDACLGLRFPPSEKKNIALHFINALGEQIGEQRFDQGGAAALAELVGGVLKRHGMIRSTTGDACYDRLMIHVQYLIARLRTADSATHTIPPQIAEELKRSYPRSHAIASELFGEIRQRLYPRLSEDEQVYFIIHIQRLLSEQPSDR